MPTRLLKKGEIERYLDVEKEIIAPQKKGYYSEAISKIDAYLDMLLDSLVIQIYSSKETNELIDALEKSLKKEYIFFSGLIKLELLKQTKEYSNKKGLILPSDLLRKNIKIFKETRNKVLHSDIGYYNLVDEETHITDKKYQKDAKEKATTVINNGLDCITDLEDMLNNNAKIIKKQKKKKK